jgi:hypothetical protein
LAWAAVFLVLWAPAGLLAAEREHGAHVHGVSQLNLAVDGQRVEMELEAPGADIVGFEHIAETTEDKAAVTRAVGFLKAGNMLFVFPAGAKCRLQTAEVESPMVEERGHQKDDGHKGKDAGHEEEGHAEFHAHYKFHCGQPASLTHVDAKKFFKRFPAAREIEVQAITPKGQRARELTPAAARLKF